MVSRRKRLLQEKLELLRGIVIDGLKPGDANYERELKRLAQQVALDEITLRPPQKDP